MHAFAANMVRKLMLMARARAGLVEYGVLIMQI
jgi:hypothetical protein